MLSSHSNFLAQIEQVQYTKIIILKTIDFQEQVQDKK